MSYSQDKELWRTHVSFAIENALNKIGKSEYEKVLERLEKTYDCKLPNCYDRPQYLKRTLKDLFGDSYHSIVNSIKKNLSGYESQKPVQEFLRALEE